jgi:hypothetical protein
MMNKMIVVCLFLAGCAGSNVISGNDFYHRLSTKPTIIEQIVSSDERKVIVVNPFNVNIEAVVDCDGENDRRHLSIAANSSNEFVVDVPEDISGRTCMMDNWTVKE